MITSETNKTIKELVKLNKSKYRQEEKKFIVEGPHLVKEAKALGLLLQAYTIDSNLEGELVSEQVMKKICSTDTVVSQIGVCKMSLKNELSDKIIILDGIQDPGNMGAIMRSAVAFGFNTIAVGNGSVDVYNPKVIRSSQGAIFKLNFAFGPTTDLINSLKDYQVFGTDVNNGTDVRITNIEKKVAVIMGNEGNGISKEVRDLGLKNLYIDIANTESLNVAVAASILMYEIKNK